MKGIYRFDPTKNEKFVLRRLRRTLIIANSVVLCYTILFVIVAPAKDVDSGFGLAMFLIFVLINVPVLLMAASSKGNRSSEEIIIEITEHDIACYQHGNENRIRFEDLGSVSENSIGLKIMEKGTMPYIRKHTASRIYNDIKGYIFIPLCVENYEEIKSFLYTKVRK